MFMWTESTTDIQWLNSTTKPLVYVTNRVFEILESSSIDQWLHDLSGDNPTDTKTNSITSDSLKQISWVNGPSLLKNSDWPFNSNRLVIE